MDSMVIIAVTTILALGVVATALLLRRRQPEGSDRVAADQERLLGLSTELAAARAAASQTAELVQRLEAQLATASQEAETWRTRASGAAEDTARVAAEVEAAERRSAEQAAELLRLREAVERLQAAETRLVEERTRLASDLDAERRAAAERLAEAERTREQVRAEVVILAQRVLGEQGVALLEKSQAGLSGLLAPLGERLKDFQAKIDKTYDQENRDRATLLHSMAKLQETQTRLHQDAESLARALTGQSKAQGDWGELVLERVLETAGLTEGREYDLQVTRVDDSGGRKRPDAIVYLPANRAVVVDAKCSLTAFVESMRTTDDAEREAALDRHLASVRGHVKALAGKSYQDVLAQRTLDIVLLFVPNEAAFHAAISRDAGLYEEAFRQGVVICSPTTLLAALQLISHVWRSEKQNVNAQRIAEEAGRLLEKLSAFVTDLDGVGARLGQAQEAFVSARAKLATGRGNVLKKAADIARLGARVKTEKIQNLLPEAAEEEVMDGEASPEAASPASAQIAELRAVEELPRPALSPELAPGVPEALAGRG